MARYGDPRYSGGDSDSPIDLGDLDLPLIIPDDPGDDQVTVPQATADQNNYALPLVGFVVFSTDASRTFTGFTGARLGLTVFYNGGSFDGVIAHNNAGSTAENRTLCHTGANITLNAGESVILAYNFAASRWVTVGFV